MNDIAKTIRIMAFAVIIFSCQEKKVETDRPAELLPKPKEKEISDLKLKDFNPVSVYKVPQTNIVKARYPIIDLHSHPYAKNAEQLQQWVQTMDEVGVDKTTILTYATGARFDSLYKVYAQYPDRFILFCGFDYTGYDQPDFAARAVAELERCVKVGARGVGELGDKGKGLFYSKPTPAYGMHIDDPRMEPLIEKCGELGIPISIHVAEPIWMYLKMDSLNDGLMNAYKWRLDNQPDILDHEEMVGTLENAVRKHPGTTFIACHYANSSYDLGILGNLFDRYPNLYADISARYAETAPIPRRVNKFFNQYQDRLVYGTDMGMNNTMYRVTFRILETEDEHFYAHELFSYHWALHGYGLEPSILKKVYRENALNILGKD
ncbi:amidohydrolase family protein [Fulvivirgaceae bacterium BMA12]|uniref:Amidohydrolase family protein n=1 Tax=Agaribacillus aureus TaxID=3051825 RepID=A0ABT8LFC3_9BACT|nr:amidohydrolase family protein [Fulvivirgaceae bacterium BMA12]